MSALHPAPGQAAAPAASTTPISEQAALQAAEWFFLLQAGDASAQDRARWQQWLAADPVHAAAWHKAERLAGQMAQLPPSLAMAALDRPAAQRRQAIRGLAALLVAAPVGWMAWRHSEQAGWLADYRTATGEQRALVLADGSQLQLDTATAIDVRYDSALRLIRVQQGAIHVQTAADPVVPARPLVVATPQGRLRALGTRFTVRVQGDATAVAVLEGAVEMQPTQTGSSPVVLQAGQQAQLHADSASAIEALAPQADSWTRGVLHVRNMRLADFAAELGRYRSGLLRCDPAVAELRLSGSFQLRDTTPVLDSLPDLLPVHVVYRSRYWVTLVPAGAS
ncbi:FecR domain-containing protein [Comamonas sp. JUb58]|uniref:FecR domain-containing protein n=1 Tax=Comamonas sp. JUb58 TaxID=2485114 RepID=UPI00105DE467|nr:FecR domain-containing protein [Comamonas sp. JUb58]TDS85027.1 FecR family protein [Comamonas sp. JUb58]